MKSPTSSPNFHHRDNALRLSGLLGVALLLAGSIATAQTSRPTSRPTSQPTSQPTSRPTSQPKTAQPALSFGDAIAEAHGLSSYSQKEALQADIVVNFGGKTMLNATMTYALDFSGARLETADGTLAVFDGEKAWLKPAEDGSTISRTRFQLLTWPYFFSAPFKLNDPGSKLEELGETKMNGDNYSTARLTFDAGVGDAPDDWYVVYREDGSNTLRALGYIVTYSKSAEEAEKKPHAIVYSGYEKIDGAALSTEWAFYNWSLEEGLKGDPIGSATLKNVRFVTPDAGAFQRPDGSVEDKLPQ